VFRVAGLTFSGCGRRGSRCLFGTTEGEEAPFFWKPPFIFDFGLDTDQISLKMSIFVDRAVGLRRSEFQYEHCLVWPLAGLHESAVCLGCDKYVVEPRLGWAVGLLPRSVCHAQSGADPDPLAVVRRSHQLVVGRENRPIRFWARLCVQGQTKHDANGSQQN